MSVSAVTHEWQRDRKQENPREVQGIFLRNSKEIVGAGDEIRTHDFNLGKVALYP
jgi:hypothetical protein